MRHHCYYASEKAESSLRLPINLKQTIANNSRYVFYDPRKMRMHLHSGRHTHLFARGNSDRIFLLIFLREMKEESSMHKRALRMRVEILLRKSI